MGTTSNKCFPLNAKGHIDKKKIREEYTESKYDSWLEFCAEKNYDWNYPHIPWGLWQRKKRADKNWETTATEIADRIAKLEPDYAKRVVQTIEKIPATMLAMWDIVQFRISLEHKKITGQGKDAEMTKAMAKPTDLLMLAHTAKVVSESIYKVMGISNAKEAIKEIHDRFDGIQSPVDAETEGEIEVVVMKKDEVTMTLDEAREKYIDRPSSSQV